MDKRSIIRQRAKMLASFSGQQLPEPTPEVMQQADRITEGTVFFGGTQPIEVGMANIDWTGSHLKHQEWPAQLNRFFHLKPLAAAYRKTGDEKYARAARACIEDWIRGDIYGDTDRCRPGDNTLNISIRLGSSAAFGWSGALAVFVDSPAFDDEFLDSVLASIDRQALWLSRHLRDGGNWRISQLDALVFTALRLPFLPHADEMLQIGIRGMRNALASQFLADGVHNERTPGYHDWMTSVAANYSELVRQFPLADAKVDATQLIRSLDYGAQAELFGVNDNKAPHKDPDLLSRLEKRNEITSRLGLAEQAGSTPPLTQVFDKAGHVFVRSAWEPGADYLAFDAGTWGGGHSHLSRLSLVFRSGGRTLVADPGIFTYEMSDPAGPYGKSTPAHSTLNIDGLNQSGADAKLLNTAFTDRIALLHARYDGGYWAGRYAWSFDKGRGNGVYGSHDRIVLQVRGEYLLVLDTMDADAGHQIHNVWQMGPMEGWEHDPKALTWWSINEDTNLLLQMAKPTVKDVEMKVWEGSDQPFRGWIGKGATVKTPAPQIDFRYPSDRVWTNASIVLLVPFKGDKRPDCRVRTVESRDHDRQHYLEVELPNGSVDHIAWTAALAMPVEDLGGLTSDAPLVWYRTDKQGEPHGLFLLEGSYVARAGRTLHETAKRQTAFVPLPAGQ